MHNPYLGLPSPRLDWSDGGVPHNLDHQDGYFSDIDGSAETRTVFLSGCGLPDAWKDKKNFTIGELGFGTGLNFLETWALWRRTRPSGARLHFISVEGAPFCNKDLKRAHAAFPALAGLSKKLQTAWPDAVKGVHRLCFDEDGITLTLYFMDISEALPQIEMQADGWFLDGFAPSRNTQMWSAEVFSHLARLSRAGTRAATFSVAGAVRRGLQDAGFTVCKMPGHGRKRERLEAVFEGPKCQPIRRHSRPRAPGKPKANSVLVLGGGIAGASTAFAFLRRGLDVTLISKAGPGDEASGNPAALVSPRLDLEDAPPARFFRTAFCHAVSTYAGLGDNIWNNCGILRLPTHSSDQTKLSRLINAHALPEHMLFPADNGTGVTLPGAGTVDPAKAIDAMTKGAKQIEAEVFTLEHQNGAWVAFDADKQLIARADIAVLALGAGTLPQTQWMSFRYLKGQITLARISTPYHGPAILAEGYALGLNNDQLLTGATYEPINPRTADLSPKAKSHTDNLEALQTFAPALAEQIDRTTLWGRVSIRAATPDQMPYAGPVVNPDDFTNRFAALKHGFLDPKVGQAQLQDHLFVLMGLGSRGFTLAPILGEAIAAEALGEPSPLERGVAEAMHPARVLERGLKLGSKPNDPREPGSGPTLSKL